MSQLRKSSQTARQLILELRHVALAFEQTLSSLRSDARRCMDARSTLSTASMFGSVNALHSVPAPALRCDPALRPQPKTIRAAGR